MNVKKLFSNKTKCTVEIDEFNPNIPQNWSGKPDGNYLFPYNEIDNASIKWLMLHDVKTADLSWIADLFPNMEMLEIDFQKNQSLISLKGIEQLPKLHGLHIMEGGGELRLDFQENLRLDYLIFAGSQSDQYTLDARVIVDKPIYVHIRHTVVHEMDHLKKITCDRLYLSGMRNPQGKIHTHYLGNSAGLELTIDPNLNG